MVFEANREQMTKLLKDLYNNSETIGMGFLQYKERLDELDIEALLKVIFDIKNDLQFDYWYGRMVKTSIKRLADDNFEVVPWHNPPRPDYQSWAARKTIEHMLIDADIMEASY
jgi:hypothetical protein